MTSLSSQYLCDGSSGNGSGNQHALELLLLHGVAESGHGLATKQQRFSEPT